jgi:hypothetical protein
MQEVAASQTAVDELLVNDDVVESNVADTVLSSSSAVSALSQSDLTTTRRKDTNNSNANDGGGAFTNKRALLVDIPKETGAFSSQNNLVKFNSDSVGNVIIKDDHPAQIINSASTNNLTRQDVDILVLEGS